MGDRDFGAPHSAVTLEAGQCQSILEVFEFRRRDEHGGRDATVCQGDVLMLGSPAGKLAELAPRLSDGIRSRH